MIGLFSSMLLVVSALLFAEPIDVVIPCHPKDFPILEKCIEGIAVNGKDVRRIIVITQKNKRYNAKGFFRHKVEVVWEESFPFTLRQVSDELGSRENRGWFFQQLLKLYAFSIIPNLTRHILILDADTIFLNPCQFVSEEGKTLFTPSVQHHGPYFSHARKLVPTFTENVYGLSGICNFMIFRKDVVEELIKEVETYHQKPFWKVFLRVVDPEWRHWVGASEFEIYFNYFLANHPEEFDLQRLKWDETLKNLKDLPRYQQEGYHFVTCHHWQRN